MFLRLSFVLLSLSLSVAGPMLIDAKRIGETNNGTVSVQRELSIEEETRPLTYQGITVFPHAEPSGFGIVSLRNDNKGKVYAYNGVLFEGGSKWKFIEHDSMYFGNWFQIQNVRTKECMKMTNGHVNGHNTCK